MRTLGVAQIARDVLLWLEEALKSKQLLLEDQQLHPFKQVETMFQESFDIWAAQQKALWLEEMREKIGEQVREEVRVQVAEEVRVQIAEEVRAQEHIATQHTTLLKLMTLKFGAREAREAQLAALSAAQLDLALERLLSAQDEDELFAP